jgi:hypothetical protein
MDCLSYILLQALSKDSHQAGGLLVAGCPQMSYVIHDSHITGRSLDCGVSNRA